MKSSSLLLLLVSAAAILFFATIPCAQSKLDSQPPTQGRDCNCWCLFYGNGTGERGKGKLRPWPCCDRCGPCTRSIPPQCRCLDMVRSCHPACKKCVRSPLSFDPPLFQCMDVITNYCKHKCSSNVKSLYRF
ncbi:Bowman-Birk type trypsin inhibitor [Ananas comosus]|uniref:Bowman-Birk type trypsin inhibitor n=1 Tax=Ananas comosus TaxID=4615 RepID=A0A199VM47_ANACO|nr:Bowman-Birk type trypsin inhibitor [Ananas comosus]